LAAVARRGAIAPSGVIAFALPDFSDCHQ
jgi:hypothetical protein